MKLLRIAAALVLATGGVFAAATPAHAGGWATTVLDPLPQRLEVGTGYTVGYWVLQHGSHPYQGDLGTTGIRLVDPAGKATDYRGVRLAEPAHYATAIMFGHAGTWRLYGIQGIFDPYEIGTVTVPGTIDIVPTPTPMDFDGDHPLHDWGIIHPPGMDAGDHESLTSTPPAITPTVAAKPAAAASGTSSALWPSIAGAVLVIGLVTLVGRRRWRAHAQRKE